ncbi:T-cell receptor gamma alternate reading frame protein isoform X1 [Phascolarctos cinereus]|uniref:TCR gamma alternate reading frame protein isoform X13 n=1 Tax=Phascolarctos cinereus TaxID=38626 RepID=UPI000A286444|nr:TCR gamma alternate reading frame protein isoform X13 [Phascolarctos cinereus]
MSGYLALLLAAALVPAGQTAMILEQRVISMIRNVGGSAILICEIFSPTFDNIHWYHYQEGRAPERLLRYSMKKSESVLDPGFSPDKIRAYKGKDNSCRLILSNLQMSDSGMYHCASWDGPAKVFGEGTKLIVTNSVIKKKPPKPIFFLPTLEEVKQKKSGTYICLLEDFFPNVVKTYWKENENSSPLNAQLGPITRTNGSYSQVSWLTVQEDNLPKNFTYFYQHEDVGIEPMAVPLPSVWEVFNRSHPSDSCEKTEVKDKGLQELHFANTSAFYTYTILLTKSAIYFTITLFFLYQKRAAGSQETK